MWRYSVDEREEAKQEHSKSVQKSGIWECTLCGECTLACPKGIDPKADIMMLRSQSVAHGYSDPSFANQSFFTLDFGLDPSAS